MMTDIVLLAQHFESVKRCVVQIRLCTDEPFRLIVVVEQGYVEIEEWIRRDPEAVVVIAAKPMGVASGYNAGAALSTSAGVVFMRDHVLVSDGWLGKLRACLERHDDAALAGPVSNDVSGPQRIPVGLDDQGDFRALSSGFGRMRPAHSKYTVKLLSHLLMANREAFDKLGGFDERYETETFEDDDLCYRALSAGYGLYIAEDCLVRYVRDYDLYPGVPGWYERAMKENWRKALDKWGVELTSALYGWRRSVTISLCMIVKNEEQTLDRCLSSVSGIVDEIVIVDTGSADRTKEIAARYTDRIYDFEWINDFSAARNFAFHQATMSYLLWLDADDILLPGDADKLRSLKGALPWNTDAVSMNYNLAFDEFGNVRTSLRRNRLVKRENGFRWIGAVHEYLEVHGRIEHSDRYP